MDGFVQIKQWPMDQVAAGFINGFTGFVGDYQKSISDQSKVEQLSMQQQANHVISAVDPVEVV